MAKNPIPLKVKNLASSIKNLISIHEEKTSSSMQKGHAKAGGVPQTIGASLSAGTDNGYYARADHIHTVNYDTILNKPTTFNPTVHSHNDIYYTKSEIDDLLDTLILDNITLDENGDLIIGSTITGLLLTSNQNTIQENETAILTATAYDAYSNIVINEPIQLYKDGVLINIFNTNNNGQISYTYNGNSSGKHEFIARNGKVVSEPYIVWDTILYDNGIIADHNDIYAWSEKFTRGNDGTTFENTAWNSCYIMNNGSQDWSNTGYALEFTVMSLSGSGETRVGIHDGEDANYQYPNVVGTHKFTFKNGVIKHYLDGVEYDYEYDTKEYNSVSTIKVFLMQTNADRKMKFKDLRFYSI